MFTMEDFLFIFVILTAVIIIKQNYSKFLQSLSIKYEALLTKIELD